MKRPLAVAAVGWRGFFGKVKVHRELADLALEGGDPRLVSSASVFQVHLVQPEGFTPILRAVGVQS